jgi:hypothetical protein
MPKKDKNKMRNKLAAKSARRKKRKQSKIEKVKRKAFEYHKKSNMLAQLQQQSKPTFDRGAWFKQKPEDKHFNNSNNTNVSEEATKVFNKGAWSPPVSEETNEQTISLDEKSFDKTAWLPK